MCSSSVTTFESWRACLPDLVQRQCPYALVQDTEFEGNGTTAITAAVGKLPQFLVLSRFESGALQRQPTTLESLES